MIAAFEQVAVTAQLVDDRRMLLSVKRELAVKAIRQVPDEALARSFDLCVSFRLVEQVPEARDFIENRVANLRVLTCMIETR